MTQAWDFIDATILWNKTPTIMDKPLTELDLSTRTINALYHNRMTQINGEWHHDPISTLRHLVGMTDRELLRVPNFGHKSLKEIKIVLQHYGLSLRERK